MDSPTEFHFPSPRLEYTSHHPRSSRGDDSTWPGSDWLHWMSASESRPATGRTGSPPHGEPCGKSLWCGNDWAACFRL
jgi:hypothetical protein